MREPNDMANVKTGALKTTALSPHFHPPLGTTWHFRFLQFAGLVVILPLVALWRLLPGHWHDRHDESVFVETNRVVLTALGFAFMA